MYKQPDAPVSAAIDEESATAVSSPSPDDSAAPELSADLHTKLTQSRAGRAGLCLLVVFTALMLALPNMPEGPFRSGVDPLWQPGSAVGLRQNWHVFSPNPRSISIEGRTLIEYEDGTREIWTVPEFDVAAGAYRVYRWRKWQERLIDEENVDHWEPTALYLAEQHERDGVLPLRITFTERKRAHYPVGVSEPIDGQWVERTYYTWERDQ